MNVNFETIKEAIKNAIIKHYGVCAAHAEDMIFESEKVEDFESEMDDIFGSRYFESIDVDIDGLSVGMYPMSMTISVDAFESDKCLALMFFGVCNDVVGAQAAIEAYSQSQIAGILPVEYAIDNEGDVFALSYSFNAADMTAFSKEIDYLFSVLDNDELMAQLSKILVYFDLIEE